MLAVLAILSVLAKLAVIRGVSLFSSDSRVGPGLGPGIGDNDTELGVCDI